MYKPSFEFIVPISPNQGFYNQIRLFNFALREIGDQYEKVRLRIVFGGEESLAEVESQNLWAKDFNIVFEKVPDKIFQTHGIHGNANYRLCLKDYADIAILCDADTVLLKRIDEIFPFFDTKHPVIAGHIAHYPPPLLLADSIEKINFQQIWPQLFQTFGVKFPNKTFEYTMMRQSEHRTPIYYNLGFLALNKPAIKIYSREIHIFDNLFKTKFDSNMRCQIAMTIIGYKNGVEFLNFPARYNAANDIEHSKANDLNVRDIKLLHYLREDEFERQKFLSSPYLEKFLSTPSLVEHNELLKKIVRRFVDSLEGVQN